MEASTARSAAAAATAAAAEAAEAADELAAAAEAAATAAAAVAAAAADAIFDEGCAAEELFLHEQGMLERIERAASAAASRILPSEYWGVGSTGPGDLLDDIARSELAGEEWDPPAYVPAPESYGCGDKHGYGGFSSDPQSSNGDGGTVSSISDADSDY